MAESTNATVPRDGRARHQPRPFGPAITSAIKTS